MRQLVLADLRHRFPQADDDEIRRRFIARVLPREMVIRAYGFDPREEGFDFKEDWHTVREDFELNTPKALANVGPVETPKAFANCSPGLERSDNPGCKSRKRVIKP
jgi:hypothetical protein